MMSFNAKAISAELKKIDDMRAEINKLRTTCTIPANLEKELKAQVKKWPDIRSEINKVTSKFKSLTDEEDKSLHEEMEESNKCFEPLIKGYKRFQKDKSILSNMKNERLSLIVGITGSGKSCITNSVVKGPESLRKNLAVSLY